MANKIVQLTDNGDLLYPIDYMQETNLSLLNGWSDNGIFLRRVGRTVILNCSVRYGTSDDIANIPVGYRPRNALLAPAVDYINNRIGYVMVKNGKISTNLANNNSSITSTAVWLTDD